MTAHKLKLIAADLQRKYKKKSNAKIRSINLINKTFVMDAVGSLECNFSAIRHVEQKTQNVESELSYTFQGIFSIFCGIHLITDTCFVQLLESTFS